MRFGKGYAVIAGAVLLSIIGTFFASNAITGFSVAKDGVSKGDFASLTGKAVSDASASQTSSLQTVVGAVLFAMAALSALVVVARIGRTTVGQASETNPGIKGRIQVAEKAIASGNHREAYVHYNALREQYAKLNESEKATHYPKLAGIHRKLTQKSNINEAQYLTDKYVNGTITEEEFQRLKQLIVSQ